MEQQPIRNITVTDGDSAAADDDDDVDDDDDDDDWISYAMCFITL